MQIFTAENSMPKFENDDAVLESSDLLKTRYPAFADKIQRAREAGFDDDSIYKRIADHEAEALLSRPAEEVNRMAGRTEESMKLADRIERKQKRDAYVEIYKDKLKEEDVDDRMRAAEVLSVSPVVFLRNDDLYKRMAGHIKVRESYLETVGNAIRGNELQGANANIGMRMIWGEDSPELWAQVESNDAELEKLALPVDRKFGQEGLSGAVDVSMQMASGARRGLPYAVAGSLAGAGFALAAGQAGPQVLIPEEILTVPGAAIAGAGVGISTGMVVENFSREAGSAMLEFSSMTDQQGNPMDRDAARAAAFLVGLINTGIEQLQMERIVKSVPGGEKLFSKMTAPMVRKLLEIPVIRSTLSKAGGRIVDVGKGYVADTTVETIQEVLQETVTILCGRLGVALSGQEYASLDLGESIDRLAETGSSSAKAMSVLFAPGAAMRGVGALRSRVKGDSKSPLPPATGETGELSDSSNVAGENRVEEIGEKIFLPAEAIERYNQDNPGALDTIEVHPQPIEGTDEVMVTAKELDRLKQDAPDLVDSIRGDIRLGADGKTVSELGESVVEKIERESERPEIQKQIAQEIEEKVISAGRPKSEAKVMGKISSSFAMQISRLTGISPQDAVKLDMRKAVFDEVKEGRLRYMDTKKSSAWLDATGLYLPGGGAKQSFLNQNIPTEADLVKARAENPGYYQWDLDNSHSAAFEPEDMETVQTKLARDVAAWEKTVDSFSSGKLSQKRPFRVMTTPIAMLLADGDIAFKEIITNKSILEKVLKEKHVEVTPELLKQVPAALADPVMVFKSATVPGSYVSMLELRDTEGGTIVVPVALNASEPGKQAFMTSVYGKSEQISGKVEPRNEWFIDQIKQGNLRYINTEKSANWARDGGLQLPIMSLPAEALSNSNIPTEADLVKARTEHPGYYQDSATPNARLEIFPDGHSLISFFETANKSTSFHEFAHHMFRMMVDLRDVPGADAQFKADVDTVFRAAGVSLKAFQNDSAARTEVHEFFARGFETYLSEGKAPTKALRGAFKRLRAWLIGVYRDVVASLGIELSDPMRDVYARLLATQEDIDRETTINHLATEMIALKKEIKARSEEMRKAESEAIEFERAPLDDLKARQKEIRQGMKDKTLRREVDSLIKDVEDEFRREAEKFRVKQQIDSVHEKGQTQLEKAKARFQTQLDAIAALKEKQKARKALKKEINRLVREINRMARIKVISWGKRQSIKEILAGYDLKRRQQKTMERRADLEKYLNENPEAVNDFHEDDVKLLGATTLNDMTLGELQDLHRKVGEEYKQGRREYAAWEEERKERASTIHLGMLESLKKKSPKVAKVKKGTEDVGKQYKGPVGAVEKVVDWERSALLGPDRFFDWLDGGGTSYVGAFVQNFVDKLNDCKNSELLHVGERTQKMAEALRDLGLKVGEFGKKIMTIEGVDFTYDEAMEVYVGMANEKKRAAILHGVLKELSDPEAAATRLINALDDPHRKAAWLVVEDHDRNVDRIDEIMVRTFNRGMVREKNYTSIHRLEYIAKGQLIDEDMELAMFSGESAAGVMQRIEDGFTLARVTISEENQAPIKLGLYANWHTDVARQEHLAAFAGHTKDLASAMMMRDPETGQTLGQMVKERFGYQAWKTLMDNFNVNVTDQKQVAYGLMDGLVSKVMRNMAVSYLGINFGTAMKQLTSLPRFTIALTTTAGPKHFMTAIFEFLLKGPRFLDEIYSMDPQLKERKGNALFEGMRYAPNVSERFKKYVDASLYPISLMDRWVAAIGWKAVYNSKIESMGKAEAAREAQRVVRLTQQAAHVKDTARIWRQNGLIRLGMIFTSDLASVLGLVTYDFVEQLRTKQWNKLMGTTVAIVLPALLMKAVVDGLPDEDDDEKYGEWISSALAEQTLTSVPLIGRELVNIYDTRFQGKYWGGQYSPMATPFDKLARASIVLTDEDADDKARTKAIWDGLEGLSLMGAGIPITGIRRLVQFNGIAEEEGMGNAVKSLVGMKRRRD